MVDYIDPNLLPLELKKKALAKCRHPDISDFSSKGIINIFCHTCRAHKYLNYSFDKSMWDAPDEYDLYLPQAEWVSREVWDSWMEGEIAELPRKKKLVKIT